VDAILKKIEKKVESHAHPDELSRLTVRGGFPALMRRIEPDFAQKRETPAEYMGLKI